MQAIRVERSEGLVTITLNRPEKKNAINAQTWIELDGALAEVAADPADRALVLTGAGGNFSAGADLSPGQPGQGVMGRGMQPIVQEMRAMGDIILRLHRLPKPTLARVNGDGYGGALGLLGACDIVIAVEEAKFAFTEVRLGIIPAVISPFVLGKIGELHGQKVLGAGYKVQGAGAQLVPCGL